MLASVITLVVSRALREVVRAKLRREARRVREERRAALFASVATSILDVVPLPQRVAKALARRPERMVLHEAIDPNIKRLSLLERVDRDAAWTRQAITDAARPDRITCFRPPA